MTLSDLVAEVRRAYEHRPDLVQLVDESVVETLELTAFEVVTLAALLVAGGLVNEAMLLSRLKERQFTSALSSLLERGLVTQTSAGEVSFDGAERALRMQNPVEVKHLAEEDDEELPPGPPSVKVVLRPLREQVLMLARSADTPTRGLARVWSFVFGGKLSGRDFGALGLIAKALGRDQAALLLLEFAHKPMRPADFVPIARARSTPWRPEDAPDVEEQAAFHDHVRREALMKRLRLYKYAAQQGRDPAEMYGEQYGRDIAEWRRIGRPEV